VRISLKLSAILSAMTLSCAGLVVGSVGASAAPAGRILYSSLAPLGTPNLPSLGPEAYSFSQIGNEVTAGATASTSITTALVQMSSWACEQGNWTGLDAQKNAAPCVTTPGATFQVPITLNLYAGPAAGGETPGALLWSGTQTFTLPYRPSSITAAQAAAGTCEGDATAWLAGDGNCYHGLLSTVKFKVPGIVVPRTFVYGISYNTTDHGPVPIGPTACNSTSQGCPYDSLNVALSDNPSNTSVGTDTNPGTLWWDTSYAGWTCDGGTGYLGVFHMDAPGGSTTCWSDNAPSYSGAPYLVPAVEFLHGQP
jgi:hypothetical protein